MVVAMLRFSGKIDDMKSLLVIEGPYLLVTFSQPLLSICCSRSSFLFFTHFNCSSHSGENQLGNFFSFKSTFSKSLGQSFPIELVHLTVARMTCFEYTLLHEQERKYYWQKISHTYLGTTVNQPSPLMTVPQAIKNSLRMT